MNHESIIGKVETAKSENEKLLEFMLQAFGVKREFLKVILEGIEKWRNESPRNKLKEISHSELYTILRSRLGKEILDCKLDKLAYALERYLNGYVFVSDDELLTQKLLFDHSGKYSTFKISAGWRGDTYICEDNVLVDENLGLFIIADGHASKVRLNQLSASSLVVEYVYEYIKQHFNDENPKMLLKNALEKANEKFKKTRDLLKSFSFHFERESDGYDCFGRTTVDIGLIKNSTLHYLRVGDGILRLLMDNGEIISLFKERHAIYVLEYEGKDKLETAKERLKKQKLGLNEAIGRMYEEGMPRFEYKEISLKGVQKILIASDGLQYISNSQIKKILEETNSLDEAVKRLIVEARMNPNNVLLELENEIRNKKCRSEDINDDDIAVILIDVQRMGERVQEKASAKEAPKKEDQKLHDVERIREKYRQCEEENKKLVDKIEKLERKITEQGAYIKRLENELSSYERSKPKEAKTERFDRKLQLDEIITKVDAIKRDVGSRYVNYIINYALISNGKVTKIGKSSFGVFMAREYEKIKKVCSDISTSSLLIEAYKEWCEKQLSRTTKWILIAKRHHENYVKEIEVYRSFLKELLRLLK